MPKKGEPRYDTCWRKSRIAARILLREEAGKLTKRDVALGKKLADDREVLPRLIQQALNGFEGRRYRLGRPAGQKLDLLGLFPPAQTKTGTHRPWLHSVAAFFGPGFPERGHRCFSHRRCLYVPAGSDML